MSRPADLPWLEPEGPGLSVWALDPFLGGSHRDFLEGLARHSAHEISLQGLPGRNWSWRMQGGAVQLALQAAQEQGCAPQVVLAASMLDVPLFKALAPPAVSAAPFVVYFHENQLTYPLPPGRRRDLSYGWKNVTTALAADRVLFNSAFHQGQFLAAAADLLARLPDCVPAGVIERIQAKSSVLPLGCDLRRFDALRPDYPNATRPNCADSGAARWGTARWGDPALGPLIVWNQRWEYDKGPDLVVAALAQLAREGVRFRVAFAGAGHGRAPACLLQAREELGERVVQFGAVRPFERYADLLWEADIVVSAARHEFFGQAVVEAIYCGCRPVLPHRLSYPELIPSDARADVLYAGEELAGLLHRAVEKGREWPEDWQRTWVARFDWGNMASHYDRVLWRVWEER